MPFKPPAVQPEFNDIKAILIASKIQTQNNALFQAINQLIDSTRKFQTITRKDINTLEAGDVTNITIGDDSTSFAYMLMAV